MKKKISKKFIKGIGSVRDIYPNKSYPIRSYNADKTTADRLQGDWAMVGKTISKIISYHINGQK